MSGQGRGRLVVEASLLHLAAAAALGGAWWALAPQLAYTVVGEQAFVLDDVASRDVFDGDAIFAVLGVLAGLLCASVLLARGYRGAVVPVVLATGGALGSVIAWFLAVQLGPGRLDDLVAAAGEGEIVAGPELNSYAAMLVWPIVAVGVVLVVTALSAPERTRRRPSPA